MQYNLIVIAILSALASFPTITSAASESHFLNDGKPLRVHVHQQTKDRDENVIRQHRSHLNMSGNQSDKSKQTASTTRFQLPLRRGLSNNDPNVMTIAAFVDHDGANPDSLLDWNCGERTYDSEGFDHNGTDYNGGAYPWLSMANDGMVVVAAGDGEIIDRHDGEPDQNCSIDPSNDSNLVVLQHSDGKITIYAHLKKGTVTPRKIGDTVEQGDYLGVMGSSGLSNGPHLHLGVQDRFNDLFDPYAGECNSLNNDSLWENQEDYKVQQILSVATHSAFPEFPPCPQQEVPHFKDVFSLQDIIFTSVTLRDIDETDEVEVTVRNPVGAIVTSSTLTTETPGHRGRQSFFLGFQLGSSATAGKYSWEATYAGQTMKHEFYVGDEPGSVPGAKPANNAYTGLWYDPALDGEGFNIVTSDSGTIVYFYGSDDRGNRVWLISDLISGEIKTGQAIEVLMYESSGGIFPTPVPSARGLSIWGLLKLTFNTCTSGQSILTGEDGNKVSQITKLAGVSGASCVTGDVPSDAPWAGLWYDPASDGEGYNLIVSPVGRILYFYGFRTSGLRLWLVSDPISQALDAGSTIEVTLYQSTLGTFATPIPSSTALVVWGTAKITVVDCSHITIVIDGTDGKKTSNTVRLAGIIGSSCS